MKLNTILSELVVLANTLDEKNTPSAAADLDAAIFILSSDDAAPINKSMSSIIRENYAVLANCEQDTLEDMAVAAAENIKHLQAEILKLEPKLMVAFLKSIGHSLSAVMHPDRGVAADAVRASADLLADAEKKLLNCPALQSVGYKIGVVRARLEDATSD